MNTENKKTWNQAHESAGNFGQQGITTALELTTQGIQSAGAHVAGQVVHLSTAVENLNKNLQKFNDSSSDLASKAYNLSWWVMLATIVSASGTAVTAIVMIIQLVTHSQ